MPMPTLTNLISVAAGGAIGASARYGVSIFFANASRFAWPTFTVNVLGCFVAGMLGTWLLLRTGGQTSLQLFLVTGILGGFTTFSAFSLDTLRLAEAGHWSMAAANVVANVAGSLLAVGLGWWLARTLLT